MWLGTVRTYGVVCSNGDSSATANPFSRACPCTLAVCRFLPLFSPRLGSEDVVLKIDTPIGQDVESEEEDPPIDQFEDSE